MTNNIPDYMKKPLKELPFVILDLETTGFKAASEGITEIAIISSQNGQIETFETLIDPERPIPKQITEITGITDEMVAGKPKIAEVLPFIDSLFENSIFVAHNVPFDWSFLDFAFQFHLKKPLKMPSLCTLRLSRKLLGLRSNKLGDVARHLGVKLTNAHRAMNDTKALKDILFEILSILEKQGVESGEQLYGRNLIFPETPPAR